MPATAPIWVLALLLIPVGLTGPLIMPPTSAVLLDHAPAGGTGVASGVFDTSQLGGALAVAVFGALTATSAGCLHGQRISLILTAVVAMATALAAIGLTGARPAAEAAVTDVARDGGQRHQDRRPSSS
ncbi:hypothetical protein [Pseudonocardia sp. NPDC049154]|uniref:hypothetical protein n=1 Tax=Pseudonocardia sp. NPDC049154 TaxID=3155501 RepID=UPI0033F4551E